MNTRRSYRIWRAMKQRCDNPKHTAAAYYSELDITYCESWKDFSAFFADMGECPEGLQLDRKDNNKGYSPDNCQWVTAQENLRKSGTTKLTAEKVRLIKGLLRSLKPGVSKRAAHKALGELFGVSYKAIWGIETGRNWSDIL